MNTVRPLEDRARLRLLSCAALLCVVPATLAPLAARPSLVPAATEGAAGLEATMPPPPQQQRVPGIRRDPFAGEPPALAAPSGAQNGGMARVAAIVSGASPRALVEESGGVRIVGIGDRFAGFPVTAIDSRGIHLQNGALVPLAVQPQ